MHNRPRATFIKEGTHLPKTEDPLNIVLNAWWTLQPDLRQRITVQLIAVFVQLTKDLDISKHVLEELLDFIDAYGLAKE